ncbi:unnamed protein product [Ectocarpus sp. 12 AP-2014]
MPRRVQKISRTLLDLTTTLILSRFPNIRALMVLSFGEVGDQGDARHCLVWAGKDNKVGMLAAHHSCTIRGGLPAATSNFAGLCLLHHAAWDRARYQSLEDLGGEGQRRAAADAVDVLVSARGFIQSKKGAAAFGGEKEALRAGVEKNDEVFEQAFDVIPSRLDPALFTTQQRSDGGEEARTATVDGQKVAIPEAVGQGTVAATPNQEAAMRQRSEDSGRGGKCTL